MKPVIAWRKRMLVVFLSLSLCGVTPASFAQMPAKTGQAAKNSKTAKLTSEQKAIHLLNRISFGPTSAELARVLGMGWDKYLEEQLSPEKIADAAYEQKMQNIPSARMSLEQLAKTYPQPALVRRQLEARGVNMETLPQQGAAPAPATAAGGQPGSAADQAKMEEYAKSRREIERVMREMGYKPQRELVQDMQQARILRAVYSQRQLHTVLTDFWFNHFNVYADKGPVKIMLTPYERDTIAPRVLGKFEDLLLATAKSPAMLFYLDNWLSAAADARTPDMYERLRRIRAARGTAAQPGEQMEMQKATPAKKRGRGINENYAREIMELHTLGVDGGYTQKDVMEVARCFTGWTLRNPQQGGDFYFASNMHDNGEKVVLGNKIPAGGGMKDGEDVIRILARHPSTARFIATKLARRFVSDNPPKALIDRTAQVFLKTDGDLRQVAHALLTAPEFMAPENYRAKIKTPFEMTVSAVRALGAETDGTPTFHRWIAQMGEPLFQCQPPTGYDETAETWVNTGALLQRMNFALALSANRINGTRVTLPVSASAEPRRSEDIAGEAIKLLLHGDVSAPTRATLGRQIAEGKNTSADPARGRESETARVFGLVLGSPEFQRQ
ncbi:MAG: DUF1800 domain-containing protein [Blastocatellia bacterium]